MVPRSHFMHQGHALVQNLNTIGYCCGGCKTDGIGTNFGCAPCSFHMHEFCSNCPMILSSFLHPEHPLSLMISNTLSMAPPRICDVCRDTVEGLFYWCQTCNFSVHPLCTRFPQSHAVHYPHHLMFQTGMPPNINSYNVHNPNLYYMYYPCNTNPCSMYNPQNGASFNSTLQHVQNHHGDTSHQAPAQGQELGKLGKKIFGIVSTLTLGVISNVIFEAICSE
ncbi:hypothetical protein POM88_041002 [Heracleum sosnowskyi]|uniref:DC1 domain-containing protein n=1 Tax=Heracleum sosnowskyi TaxID=360622 RepID=A0AAD8HF79_9APIA|nr:hypothetical protein POM88_041002 [Heracleum sosnowskyi]